VLESVPVTLCYVPPSLPGMRGWLISFLLALGFGGFCSRRSLLFTLSASCPRWWMPRNWRRRKPGWKPSRTRGWSGIPWSHLALCECGGCLRHPHSTLLNVAGIWLYQSFPVQPPSLSSAWPQGPWGGVCQPSCQQEGDSHGVVGQEQVVRCAHRELRRVLRWAVSAGGEGQILAGLWTVGPWDWTGEWLANDWWRGKQGGHLSRLASGRRSLWWLLGPGTAWNTLGEETAGSLPLRGAAWPGTCLFSCFSVLLAGADLNLAFGRRYGLVGRNGLGKTTLLKMIASRSLRIPSHISILHVEQEVAGDETPALQSVLECDTTRESLLREERDLTARINAGRWGVAAGFPALLWLLDHEVSFWGLSPQREGSGRGCVLPTVVLPGQIHLPQHSHPDPHQSRTLLFVLPQGRRDRRCQAVADLREAGGDWGRQGPSKVRPPCGHRCLLARAVFWGMEGWWNPACGDRDLSLLLFMSLLLSQLCWVRSSRASPQSWRDISPPQTACIVAAAPLRPPQVPGGLRNFSGMLVAVTLFLAKELKACLWIPSGTSHGCYELLGCISQPRAALGRAVKFSCARMALNRAAESPQCLWVWDLRLCSAVGCCRWVPVLSLFPRASVILAGLGFNAKMQQQTTK